MSSFDPAYVRAVNREQAQRVRDGILGRPRLPVRRPRLGRRGGS
ncbi:MAG: hypothetical protein QM572_09560 [Nocardioides sp.]